jgi:Fe-S-cluster containining protein
MLAPGQEEFCFPLSEIERHRILETGADKGFFAQEVNSAAFLDTMRKLFPGEEERLAALFPDRGSHFRLATHPDGRCKLLGPQGCTLPREARPYYCRLFPLWPERGEFMVFGSGRCLARQEARGLAAILRILGENQANLRHLHGRLRLAWGLTPRDGDALFKDILNRKHS